MSQWKLIGHEDRKLDVEAETRGEAVAAFRERFPAASIDFAEAGGSDGSGVVAQCDACDLPIFDDEDNVGRGCDLHAHCAESGKAT